MKTPLTPRELGLVEDLVDLLREVDADRYDCGLDCGLDPRIVQDLRRILAKHGTDEQAALQARAAGAKPS